MDDLIAPVTEQTPSAVVIPVTVRSVADSVASAAPDGAVTPAAHKMPDKWRPR